MIQSIEKEPTEVVWYHTCVFDWVFGGLFCYLRKAMQFFICIYIFVDLCGTNFMSLTADDCKWFLKMISERQLALSFFLRANGIADLSKNVHDIGQLIAVFLSGTRPRHDHT